MIWLLCTLFAEASDQSTSVTKFFKLIHSETIAFNSNVKYLTRHLYQPYIDFCTSVPSCDTKAEAFRRERVGELKRRMRVLEVVELILWRLRQRREAQFEP